MYIYGVPDASPTPLPEDTLPTDVLRALADPTRQRILGFMLEIAQARRNGEDCFGGSISQRLGLTQPTVSHHMKALVEAGLVESCKEGTTVYYSLGRVGWERLRQGLGPYFDLLDTPACDLPDPTTDQSTTDR